MQPPDDIEIEDAGFALLDLRRLREHLTFVLASVRRRRWSFAIIVAVIVAGTVAGLATMPRTYRVETKVLAQRNPALAVRADGPSADAPTRAAAEIVLRRDNLVALIRDTDLLRHWQEHRAPAVRARDALFRWLRGPESDGDLLEDMVERLQKRLLVWTNDGTVSIAVDWPDPQMACRLVSAAQESFLQAKHSQEISALAESISILESHAKTLRADVDDALTAVKQLRPDARDPSGDVGSRPAPRRQPASAAPVAAHRERGADPGLADLRRKLEAKQHAIDDLEDFRRRRLSELQAQLAERRAVYTENHPAIVDLQQAIAALSRESPQTTSLRQELAELRGEIEHRSADGTPSASPAATPPAGQNVGADLGAAPPQLPTEILRLDGELRDDRDPSMIYARGRLRDAMDKYAALRTQIETAQIDLDTSEAAFKYRYSVITPPQPPRRPSKPNAPLVLLVSLLSGLLAATLASVVAELRAGRLLQPWQLERMLGTPLLGEVDVFRALESGPP